MPRPSSASEHKIGQRNEKKFLIAPTLSHSNSNDRQNREAIVCKNKTITHAEVSSVPLLLRGLRSEMLTIKVTPSTPHF